MSFSISPNRWAALTLIVVAQFMVVLDVSIVNVALSAIKTDLGFSESGLQWGITAYAIVFGGFLLLGGGPRFPYRPRRLLMSGLPAFLAGAALSGVAGPSGSLYAFPSALGPGSRLSAATSPSP